MFSRLQNLSRTDQRIEEVIKDIEIQYCLSYKKYNNLNHIEYCLDQLELYVDSFDDIDAAYLALLYHGIVYNPLMTNNEKQSIKVFQFDAVRLDIDVELRHKVHELIMDTKHKRIPNSKDGKLVSDIDLSILANKDKYPEYMKNIREESSYISDDIYIQNRIEELNRLKRSRIFYSEEYFMFDEDAKSNIQEEILYWTAFSQ